MLQFKRYKHCYEWSPRFFGLRVCSYAEHLRLKTWILNIIIVPGSHEDGIGIAFFWSWQPSKILFRDKWKVLWNSQHTNGLTASSWVLISFTTNTFGKNPIEWQTVCSKTCLSAALQTWDLEHQHVSSFPFETVSSLFYQIKIPNTCSDQ